MSALNNHPLLSALTFPSERWDGNGENREVQMKEAIIGTMIVLGMFGYLAYSTMQTALRPLFAALGWY